MKQLPEDAIRALIALKAQHHYSTLVLEDEQMLVKPKGIFFIGGPDTKIVGNSGKGKSLLPKKLLREAEQEIDRCEPFTTKIAKAISTESQVTIETADEDWLRTLLADS